MTMLKSGGEGKAEARARILAEKGLEQLERCHEKAVVACDI